MKNKIIIGFFITILTPLVFSSFKVTTNSSSCFTEFRDCNASAENTFNESDLTPLAQSEYVQSVSNCLVGYDFCTEHPN